MIVTIDLRCDNQDCILGQKQLSESLFFRIMYRELCRFIYFSAPGTAGVPAGVLWIFESGLRNGN